MRKVHSQDFVWSTFHEPKIPKRMCSNPDVLGVHRTSNQLLCCIFQFRLRICHPGLNWQKLRIAKGGLISERRCLGNDSKDDRF